MNTDIHPPLKTMHVDDLRLIKTNLIQRRKNISSKLDKINRLIGQKEYDKNVER